MSIKPEYVRKIESGLKLYEFRRVIFTEISIPKFTTYLKGKPHYTYNSNAKPVIIYVYESSPVQAVTGCIQCEEVIANSPKKLWELFSNHAGISEKDFFNYFKFKKGRYPAINTIDIGFALKIKDYQVFKNPIYLKDIYVDRAPQNFQYLRHYQREELNDILSKAEQGEQL
ncbi:hypothetical protein F1737_08945 [Methanoplanus sp. FWC-SCC4]|uniref:ASCH domain-containing protein n=1 Tax=Methanochimaera problematica TaxID=2609417 RepID=A0AA97FG33_9EURY|nr:hypothetical protein [Methanoplanus sp. FWC-SCC4]WOF16806.1 hypothetical protein F1737_08945 [Methanoplanus sp. FWC-SCC4]